MTTRRGHCAAFHTNMAVGCVLHPSILPLPLPPLLGRDLWPTTGYNFNCLPWAFYIWNTIPYKYRPTGWQLNGIYDCKQKINCRPSIGSRDPKCFLGNATPLEFDPAQLLFLFLDEDFGRHLSSRHLGNFRYFPAPAITGDTYDCGRHIKLTFTAVNSS